MYEIRAARFIAPTVKQFFISSPDIARSHQPGQFVMLRVHENGERIPITIADSDPAAGIITLIVQGVGRTTRAFNLLEAGDELHDLVGPLGNPMHIEYTGSVVCIGGGVGTAEALPLAAAMRAAGNHVTAIIGARTREMVVAEKQMRIRVDRLIVTTDDGSYGTRGRVTDALEPLLQMDDPPGLILAIGPLAMMSAVAELTRPHRIKTIVSLNTIMLDGIGMCGGCRTTVGGKIKFVCVDGPEFDGHKVDFAEMARRQNMYIDEQRCSLERILQQEQPPKDREISALD